jgi:cytoskeletal protein CcmA (bactofilin family)
MDKKVSKSNIGSDVNCRIGVETKVTGNVKASEDILINGEVSGDIDVKAKVYIGQSGQIKGKIMAYDVIVEGKVEGNLNAENRIELMDSAYVTADMECKNLAVADGAFFEGKVQMEGVDKIKTTLST